MRFIILEKANCHFVTCLIYFRLKVLVEEYVYIIGINGLFVPGRLMPILNNIHLICASAAYKLESGIA